MVVAIIFIKSNSRLLQLENLELQCFPYSHWIIINFNNKDIKPLWLHLQQNFLSSSDLLFNLKTLCSQNYCSFLKECLKMKRGLPWWRSGWESACQCRGHGFEPWSGKIPHAAEQLGPWATITEPARLEPVLHNKRGRDSERPAHRNEEWSPLATTRESPCTETKTQHSHK